MDAKREYLGLVVPIAVIGLGFDLVIGGCHDDDDGKGLENHAVYAYAFFINNCKHRISLHRPLQEKWHHVICVS